MPRHVAIILDGNGRWAKRRGLPRMMGHRKGVKAIFRTVETAQKLGISTLSLFCFSTENWKRPPEEIRGLMRLLDVFVRRQRRRILEQEIRIHWLGRSDGLTERTVTELKNLVADTRHFSRFHLALALNYGARDEMLRLLEKSARGEVKFSADRPLKWEDLAVHLDTKFLPDVDLLIRPSGEQRLSNFLLLQSAYAELYFSNCLWPDFDEREFTKALKEFSRRQRRFGAISGGG